MVKDLGVVTAEAQVAALALVQSLAPELLYATGEKKKSSEVLKWRKGVGSQQILAPTSGVSLSSCVLGGWLEPLFVLSFRSI